MTIVISRVQFYVKMHQAVLQVMSDMRVLSREKILTHADYVCSSIDGYRKQRFNLYPIIVEEGSIVDAIYNLAMSNVHEPMIAATLAVCYMEQAWEFYNKQLKDPELSMSSPLSVGREVGKFTPLPYLTPRMGGRIQSQRG